MTDQVKPTVPPTAPVVATEDVRVTRSEEELRIVTLRRETGRARLVKYVETTTEQVTQTIPLRREQVRIEYLPVAGPGAVIPDDSARERWLVLYEEQVVVQTHWVATERVRLTTHTVNEDREISAELLREQIEIEDQAG